MDNPNNVMWLLVKVLTEINHKDACRLFDQVFRSVQHLYFSPHDMSILKKKCEVDQEEADSGWMALILL